MRDLLALDARDFAAAKAAGSPLHPLSRRSAAEERTNARTPHVCRTGAAAGEATTMIVVLVAWALITGYLFAHVAEGFIVAGNEAHVAAAVAAVRA